jgi:aldehyde dehydrogenase (NAD+)
MADEKSMYVGGEWVDSSSGYEITSTNPADGSALAQIPAGTAEDVDAAVKAARGAFEEDWGPRDAGDRGAVLAEIADRIRARADEITKTEVRDQGKPFREARADVAYAADTFEFYAGAADKIEGATKRVPGDRLNYTLREPLGVTGHIVPWNYPFQLATRSIAPALAAGNTVVAKPASSTSLSLLLLAEIAEQVDLPDGVFNVVTGTGGQVGGALAEHPDVDEITLTGSKATGVQVMQSAAENVTPVTLELGGKGPNIVFPDADLDAAVKGVAHGIFMNAGQMCWAGSRLLVPPEIRDEVVDGLVEYVDSWPIGPGLEEGTRLGPLVSENHKKSVREYVETGRKEGATVVHGGGEPEGDDLQAGNFLEPTIFTDVTPDMTIAREEIFGPVLSVLAFEDEDEALEIANGVPTGLYSGVWTSDLSRAHRMARELDYGMVSVNEYPVTFPQMPFNGFKESGVGGEQGIEALEHYTRTKAVNVRL